MSVHAETLALMCDANEDARRERPCGAPVDFELTVFDGERLVALRHYCHGHIAVGKIRWGKRFGPDAPRIRKDVRIRRLLENG